MNADNFEKLLPLDKSWLTRVGYFTNPTRRSDVAEIRIGEMFAKTYER